MWGPAVLRPLGLAAIAVASLGLPWANLRGFDLTYRGSAFAIPFAWVLPLAGAVALVVLAIARATGRVDTGRRSEVWIVVGLAVYGLAFVLAVEALASLVPSWLVPTGLRRYLVTSEAGVGSWLLLGTGVAGTVLALADRLPATVARRSASGRRPLLALPRAAMVVGFAVAVTARSTASWIDVKGPMPRSIGGRPVGGTTEGLDLRISGGELPWIGPLTLVVLLVLLFAGTYLLCRPHPTAIVALGACMGASGVVALLYRALVVGLDDLAARVARRVVDASGPIAVGAGTGPLAYFVGSVLVAAGAVAMLYVEFGSPAERAAPAVDEVLI